MDHSSTTAITPYGTVDKVVLGDLKKTYGTERLLKLVDLIDAIRPRLAEPEGVRADLLRLHSITHTIINGAALTVSPDETSVWEMADELTTEFKDWIEVFSQAVDCLAPLTELVPKE